MFGAICLWINYLTHYSQNVPSRMNLPNQSYYAMSGTRVCWPSLFNKIKVFFFV